MGKSYSKGSVSVECDIEVLLERLTHCDRIGMTVQANPDGTSWDESAVSVVERIGTQFFSCSILLMRFDDGLSIGRKQLEQWLVRSKQIECFFKLSYCVTR